jgi:hypothetical protein
MNAYCKKNHQKNRRGFSVNRAEKTGQEAAEKAWFSGRPAGSGAYRRSDCCFRAYFHRGYLYPFFRKKSGGGSGGGAGCSAGKGSSGGAGDKAAGRTGGICSRGPTVRAAGGLCPRGKAAGGTGGICSCGPTIRRSAGRLCPRR